VEGERNCIVHRVVWTVCKLKWVECVGEAGFDIMDQGSEMLKENLVPAK